MRVAMRATFLILLKVGAGGMEGVAAANGMKRCDPHLQAYMGDGT